MPHFLDRVDKIVTNWMARRGIVILRISLGVIFFWFGVLKFFPNMSSAADLAGKTIEALTFGVVAPRIALPLLATLECLIGLGLLSGLYMRAVLFLLFAQMVGTFSPLLLFGHEAFTIFPWVPTLEGQYIIKNLVLVSAAIVLGATVRGGAVISDPLVAAKAKREDRRKASEFSA